MLRLPTCLLLHQTAAGSHHDWLLGDPTTAADPAARLWTARVQPPSSAWLQHRAVLLQPIAPHRREYLRYQGPLTGNRGTVRRIDHGYFIPRIWTASRMLLDLHLQQVAARVRIDRLSEHCWRATFAPLADDPPMATMSGVRHTRV